MTEHNHEANNSLVNSKFTPAIIRQENWSEVVWHYEMAIQEVKRLDDLLTKANADVHELSGTNETLGDILRKKNTIISNVTEALQTAWEDDEISDSLVEDLKSWLELETTEETEIEIVARWYVTVTHPKGMNLGDISVDINSEPDLDGDNCEFGYVQFQETEVNEL